MHGPPLFFKVARLVPRTTGLPLSAGNGTFHLVCRLSSAPANIVQQFHTEEGVRMGLKCDIIELVRILLHGAMHSPPRRRLPKTDGSFLTSLSIIQPLRRGTEHHNIPNGGETSMR